VGHHFPSPCLNKLCIILRYNLARVWRFLCYKRVDSNINYACFWGISTIGVPGTGRERQSSQRGLRITRLVELILLHQQQSKSVAKQGKAKVKLLS
jgi:hypothetical protein